MQAASLFENDRADAIEQLHAATAIYTADGVVRRLLARVRWPRPGARLLDPSCGDGAFLATALELLLEAEPLLPLPELARRISGWEIHPGACAAAQERVAGVLTRYGRDERLARALVREADFLVDGPGTERFDVIAGNPPYLRFCNVPSLLRAEYEGTVPRWARGDLLHSFLERCALALAENGAIAFVTADRWLFNVNCARLRETLGERVGIEHVARLDVASTFYRPKARRRGTLPRIHPVEVVLSPRANVRLGGAPVFPDDTSACVGTPLGEIARVRIAPWVGPEGVFVLREDEARALPADTFVPAIDTDDLLPDGAVRASSRFVLRTSPETRPSSAALEHLARRWDRLPPRARKRTQTPWLPPERVDTVDLSGPMLVIPRIATSLRAHTVTAGVLPVNHNLTIVHYNGDIDALRSAILTAPCQAWIAARAPRLENGYLSITTSLIRALPVNLA